MAYDVKVFEDHAVKILDALPTDIMDRGEILVEALRDAAIAHAKLKAENDVNSTIIREERKVARFIAQRARYQRGFGFGMNTDRSGPTKQ